MRTVWIVLACVGLFFVGGFVGWLAIWHGLWAIAAGICLVWFAYLAAPKGKLHEPESVHAG